MPVAARGITEEAISSSHLSFWVFSASLELSGANLTQRPMFGTLGWFHPWNLSPWRSPDQPSLRNMLKPHPLSRGTPSSPMRHKKAFQGFKMFRCESPGSLTCICRDGKESPVPKPSLGDPSSIQRLLIDLSSSPHLKLSIKIRLDWSKKKPRQRWLQWDRSLFLLHVK